MLHVTLFPTLPVLYFYISTCRSMRSVPNMAVFCSSLISCFPDMLLRYVLNDFEMVPVAPIIAGITLFLHSTYYYYYYYYHHHHYYTTTPPKLPYLLISQHVITSKIVAVCCWWLQILELLFGVITKKKSEAVTMVLRGSNFDW